MTLKEEILKQLESGPKSDRELTNIILGVNAPQQRINSACRVLHKNGLIRRSAHPIKNMLLPVEGDRSSNAKQNGVIYILTNPSFPEYVKIGYADNIDERLKQLNRSECTPFAFRVFATYQVNSRLSDVKIHSIIDKINPDLRSIETFKGKKRIREFYAMAPDDAYSILEAIAEINGYVDRLTIIQPSEEEILEEETAQEIDATSTERASRFSFSLCQIPIGATIEYAFDEQYKATVVDDHTVEFNGESMTLTALAKLLSGKQYAIAGPRFFKYKGERLNDIRLRLNV